MTVHIVSHNGYISWQKVDKKCEKKELLLVIRTGFLQHFDNVSWVTGRASSLSIISQLESLKALLWKTCGDPA